MPGRNAAAPPYIVGEVIGEPFHRARERFAAGASTQRYARGMPLSEVDGMPLGVKDVIETADLPTQMGNALYAGWTLQRDAACVHALRSGGAIVLGKTVTTEFALGAAGPTTNPWNPDLTHGGSSSGSA